MTGGKVETSSQNHKDKRADHVLACLALPVGKVRQAGSTMESHPAFSTHMVETRCELRYQPCGCCPGRDVVSMWKVGT